MLSWPAAIQFFCASISSRSRHRIVQIICVILIVCTQSPGHAAEEEPEYRVLMLFGSERITLWIQEFNERLLQAIPTDLELNVTLEMLPLQTDRSLEQLADSLHSQHQNHDPDLVVSVLPEAVEFDHQYGQIYAPDATRLFILPTPEVVRAVSDEPDHYLLESGISDAAISTVTLIPELIPEVQQIYTIGGASPGDVSYFSRVRSAIEEMEIDIPVTYLQGLPTNELLDALHTSPSPENTVIVLSTYDEDRNGIQMRTGIIPELIGDHTNIPVFALFDIVLGMGAVIGGSITDAELYADRAAEMILALRDGSTNLDSVPPPVGNVFDAERLRRYGINRNLLPVGTELINDDQPLWQQYMTEIVIASSIIVFQLILIIALVQAMRRQEKAELLLRQTQKMEALGKVSGGVAHDFNNVLMAIMGNAEMAKLYMSKEPETAKNLLDKVLTASDRARDLVTQILMFSRKADEEDMKPVNLRATLKETVDMLRNSAHKPMQVELYCPDNLWKVKANTTQIQQVIMNLCNNAQDAMDESGIVEIEVRNESLVDSRKLFQQVLPVGDYLSITIRDNGEGISKEYISKVFEPFYTTKDHDKGTGLGLALVYGIIKAHGGFIDIHSEVNVGTAITCYLKASSEEVSQEEAIAKQESKFGRKESILLIDDDQMVLDAISKILTELGYSVDAYNRPVEALYSFKRRAQDYDLIFSDLSMPEMDGMRLIQNIRETRPEIPSILCTGYLDSLNQLEAESMKNFSTLKKPFNVEEISRKVHAALAA